MSDHPRPADLDHLVLATPDLAAAVTAFAAATGVDPVRGGSHTGLGTANWLVGLGAAAYLEIVGPDPEQQPPAQPRPFGIDDLTRTRLVTWAIHPSRVDDVVAHARLAGCDPGEAVPMSRRTPDGDELRWRLTPSRGVVPFLIDWGSTPHPTTRDLPQVTLEAFTLSHPEPDPVRAQLAALGVALPVTAAAVPTLTAVFGTPRGLTDADRVL